MTTNCNFCKSENLKQVFSLRKVPFAQNFVFDSFESATACASGYVKLLKCLDCGTVFNSAFNADLIVYNDQYQNEQQHSPVFQKHLSEVISLINKKFHKINSSITEIGCGKGYFVKALNDDGYTKVTGYDAAYEGNDPNIIKSLFGPGLGIGKSDLLILRHVLEHIEKPREFLKLLAEANGFEGKIYIEVPDFTWIYENKAFWDFYHEHVNYFDHNFFLKNFENPEIISLFGGQYVGVFLDLSSFKSDTVNRAVNVTLDSSVFEKSMENISGVFNTYENIYLWGASSKGVILCNYLDHDRKKIVNLIDINPRKWNKFIPGTGHKVISPEEFSKLQVGPKSIVIVVNKNYKNEVKSMLDSDINITCVEELIKGVF